MLSLYGLTLSKIVIVLLRIWQDFCSTMFLTFSVAVATPCIDSEMSLSFVFTCLLIAVSRSFIPQILFSNFSDNLLTALRIS